MRSKKKATTKASKPKKKPPYNQTSAIKSALRRAFSRSPIVREVLMEGRREVPKYNKDGSRSKKDSVQYQCGTCGEWVSSTKAEVDHVEAVVPLDASFDPKDPDWKMFIERLWCDKSNLKIICSTCHDHKSKSENLQRNLNKKAKKEK